MTTLVAQIAPGRSTQYASLARELAPHELVLSPLGPRLANLGVTTLGGQEYLKFDLPAEPDEGQLRELGMLAMTSAYFEFYRHAADLPGPLLRPLELNFQPALPLDLVMTRRYRGKTNELFTHFLCNIARFSSNFAHEPWSALRVLDPLAGGGTTLFSALVLGANVAGIELSTEDVRSTVAFVRQYAQEERLACRVKEERLKKLGLRWVFTLGPQQQQCILVNGDATQAPALLPGYKPHLIVADLPYGIQHQGKLAGLLRQAVPVWIGMLPRGGTLVLAWDATRFDREQMVTLLASSASVAIRTEPPYSTLAHRVDRVIKQRDVLVAHPLG